MTETVKDGLSVRPPELYQIAPGPESSLARTDDTAGLTDTGKHTGDDFRRITVAEGVTIGF